jgi:hypothetical protein
MISTVLALAAASPAAADLPNAALGTGSLDGAPPPGRPAGPNTATGDGSMVPAAAAPVVAAAPVRATRSYAPARRPAVAQKPKPRKKRPKVTRARVRHAAPRDVTAAQERSVTPAVDAPALAAAPTVEARSAGSGERDLTPILAALVLVGAAAVALRAAVREFGSS